MSAVVLAQSDVYNAVLQPGPAVTSLYVHLISDVQREYDLSYLFRDE